MIHHDLAVIGGGSGGFGAALAGARLGLSVILIEKGEMLGGNAVRGGVNCWEMGVGGTGIPFDLYRRVKQIPDSIGVYSYGRHGSWYRSKEERYRFLGGEQVIDPSMKYADSLLRHGCEGMGKDEAFCRKYWHGVPFEPEMMAKVMLEMLDETGNCQTLLNTEFAKVDAAEGRVRSIELNNGDTITADSYIDGTADALVCKAAGVKTVFGQEAHATYDEPGAPEEANRHVNGVTLIFRITKKDTPSVCPRPDGIPDEIWWTDHMPWVCMNHYPNGDRNMNMLPTMEGGEFIELGYESAREECLRRVYAYWHAAQTAMDEFQSYRISWIAPALGVRESSRIIGEYVLTQHDLLTGLSGQTHSDIIAIADHAMDTHGRDTGRQGCGELAEPYGVPFRCLIPQGFRNLLIACRAASFSSIAASSCRLSRTMVQFGQAAGAAAWIAKDAGVDVSQTPSCELRQSLSEQHVALDWPMPAELSKWLSQE
ncbi:MAG: FAD-dependent oxidoreductase [Planctomycetota bacterium]|nr:FAD-dependent oxidoreductase [Planctomycetota bacterium]MDP7248651.1 FAD-dependent oxidoreductase [Planctomycetota bacterium]